MQHIAVYHSSRRQFSSNEFEEAFYDAKLLFSLRHLAFLGDISQENMLEALRKAMHICYLVGEDSRHHFKQIFLHDASTGTLHIDWLMSKNGFNLMIIQLPLLNEKKAKWLWELANNSE